MRKLNYLLIWCLFLGTLISCGKEDDLQPASTASQDYQPTTAGSTWSYGGVSPYTLTATGKTKSINGRTFYEMESRQGSTVNMSYIVKEKGVYTSIGMVQGVEDLEVSILKEETPVGKPWEQTGAINGVETRMKFTIMEKDVTKVVEGKTYKNVINVKMEYFYTVMGVELDVPVTANYYFAKGVGLILSDFGANRQVPLLSYDVK